MFDETSLKNKKILFLVAEDWSFCSHRLPMARAAKNAGADVIVAVRVNENTPHAEMIQKEGFILEHIPFDRSGINPFKDLKTLKAINRIYKKYQPNLVHHVAMKPVLYGSIAAWQQKTPAVVNAMIGLGYLFIADNMKTRLLRPIVQHLLHKINNRSNTRLLLQNQDDQRTFIDDIEVEPSQTRIIRGSGVNVQKYQVTAEPEYDLIDPQKPIIATCVARMLKDKGIVELVEAARILKNRGCNIRIQLVGPVDDNPASLSQEQMAKWKKEGIVEILGARSDIAELYQKSHIAVLPSYREGLPKALLEAAACGRALIATNVPGCREICVNQKTGLLVPLKSVDPLANALQKLAEDHNLRHKLATNARQAVETQFADTIIQRQIVQLYGALMNR